MPSADRGGRRESEPFDRSDRRARSVDQADVDDADAVAFLDDLGMRPDLAGRHAATLVAGDGRRQPCGTVRSEVDSAGNTQGRIEQGNVGRGLQPGECL